MMNIRRKGHLVARALANSLLIIAGLSGAANAQYHVDEVHPHALPTLRSIPSHVPGGSHNVYGPDTDALEVEPAPPTTVTPLSALYMEPGSSEVRLAPNPRGHQLGANEGPLLAGPRGPGRETVKQRRQAQIARRMAYNDRVKTRSEMELDYEQANMWWYLANTPAESPWRLLMDSATIYGYNGYGYGTENRTYPVYGRGGPGCVPMGGYGYVGVN